MKRLAVVLAVGLASQAALADEVLLKGGGRLKGTVVAQTPLRVTIEVGAGQVTLPAARVERVTLGHSALATYDERASLLGAGDIQGWLALALWARDCGLGTQARRAFERVLELDPANATAQLALGRVLVGERWVSSDEAFHLRGYVLFEGTWMTPAERDERMAERRVRNEAERARAEREVREAEAEARVAEAQARAAEAEAGTVVGYNVPWAGSRRAGCRRHDGFEFHDRPERASAAASQPRRETPTRGWAAGNRTHAAGQRQRPEAVSRAATSASGISENRPNGR